MSKLIRTIVITSIVAIFAITAIGCSKKEAMPASTKMAAPTHTQPKIIRDESLTKQLTSEKIVTSGQVYFQGNDYVIAVISVKDGTDVTTVKSLAKKYADQLKAKYKNKKVNVQAVNNRKNLANISQ